MKYKYLLFDLDGTVSESAPGIRMSLEKAIAQLGIEAPDLSDYTLYIGPPLIDTFLHLCHLPPEQAERGAQLYRDYYNAEGKYRNRAYDGIRALLCTLREKGARLAICTSKYERFAEEIVEILGLTDCFDAVCGSNLDGSRKDKKDLIPYALETIAGDAEAAKKNAVMIGDTWYDARGARLCGVDFIGVAYGYGALQPMLNEGASALAQTVEELQELLTQA